MGLDMYAFTTTSVPPAPVDFDEMALQDRAEITYWRKHPNLHGWMEKLYREKGGTDEQFNCAALQLTAEDLDRLEADLKAAALPETRGFFFGASDGSEVSQDLDFVAKARQAIADGKAVYYTSWW